jgi:hypothetical protein
MVVQVVRKFEIISRHLSELVLFPGACFLLHTYWSISLFCVSYSACTKLYRVYPQNVPFSIMCYDLKMGKNYRVLSFAGMYEV